MDWQSIREQATERRDAIAAECTMLFERHQNLLAEMHALDQILNYIAKYSPHADLLVHPAVLPSIEQSPAVVVEEPTPAPVTLCERDTERDAKPDAHNAKPDAEPAQCTIGLYEAVKVAAKEGGAVSINAFYSRILDLRPGTPKTSAATAVRKLLKRGDIQFVNGRGFCLSNVVACDEAFQREEQKKEEQVSLREAALRSADGTRDQAQCVEHMLRIRKGTNEKSAHATIFEMMRAGVLHKGIDLKIRAVRDGRVDGLPEPSAEERESHMMYSQYQPN